MFASIVYECHLVRFVTCVIIDRISHTVTIHNYR